MGFGLSLSLRRYIPGIRNMAPFPKTALSFIMTSIIGIYSFWTMGIPRYLSAIRDLREDLVTKSTLSVYLDDFQYLHFLKNKYLKYRDLYPKEVLVFQEFMNEDRFIQWWADTPQYVFEEGEEPKLRDFSDPTKFELIEKARKTQQPL